MDFSKICRLCCDEQQQMRSILEEEEASCSLKEIFSNVLQIEVYSDDQLPQKVCHQCIVTLIKLNETIDAYRENDLRLRRQLYGGMAVKEELEEMEIELLEEEPDVEELKLRVEMNSLHAETSNLEVLFQSDNELQNEERGSDEEYQKEEFLGDVDTDDDYKPGGAEEFSQDENEGSLADRKLYNTKTKKQPRSNLKRPRRKGKPGRPKTAVKPENIPRVNDFICYICKSEPFESNDALFTHLHVEHTGDIPYTCPFCVKETIVIDCVTTLNVHKKMHEMPHQCPHCDRRFSCKRGVYSHVKRMHESLNDPCPSKCPQCGKVCPTKLALHGHMNRHKTEIACEICGKLSVSKHKLRIHIARKHTANKEKVECHICHKLLESTDSVRSHIKFMHTPTEEPLQCPQCSRSFTSQLGLENHIKRHERDPVKRSTVNWKQYYTFVEDQEGVKHGERMKKCNLCGAILRQISMHMTKVHFPQEFPCTLCEAVFKERKPLQVHMLEHTQGKFLKCPICGREFMERKYLLKHLQTKRHRDHPLAKSTEWLDAKYPVTVYGRKTTETVVSEEKINAEDAEEIIADV